MDQMWFCCEARERLEKVADEFDGIAEDLLISLKDGWMDDKDEQLKRAREYGNYMAHRITKIGLVLQEVSKAHMRIQLKRQLQKLKQTSV